MDAELSKAYFLKDLGAREVEKLALIARRRDFKGGDEIVAPGCVLNHLYVIGRGRVRVTVPIEPGRGGDGSGMTDEVLVTLEIGRAHV